jgi:TrmH family RNA methyltransferase
MLSFKDVTFLEKNKKARDTQGLFVAEGRKLFMEAPAESIVQVLMTKRFAKEHPEVLERIPAGCFVTADIDETRFFGLSDTKTPQGILTVLKKMDWRAEEIFQGACPFYMILENLQDPGNAGTILRTGEAAGVTAVFLTEGSVDLYSPKTIRSTMGSIYRVPHFYVPSGKAIADELFGRAVNLYAAHLRGRRVYTDCDFRGGTAFAIGNESRGISEELALSCSELIRIPMLGKVESLNAAMAAGVLMYETQRQRRAM